MRSELVIGAIAAAAMANTYTEGALLRRALTGKKYYQMAGIALGALLLLYLLRHNPLRARELIASSGEYVKYLPIDRGAVDMLSPILDMTSRGGWGAAGVGAGHAVLNAPAYAPTAFAGGGAGMPRAAGIEKVKRSVSETKKKYVAARQTWHCGHCKKLLNHTFEVDHMLSLNNGGSNHVDNLVALCPACHREKTSMENMDSQI